MSGLDKIAFLLVLIGMAGMLAVMAGNPSEQASHEDKAEMSRLLDRVEKEFSAREKKQPDRAEQIMDLWNLTEADIAKPIHLFGKDKL